MYKNDQYKLTNSIKAIMRERYFFRKKDLKNLLHLNTKDQHINTALTTLVDDKNELITGKNGLIGHLINIGDLYLFQPNELYGKNNINMFDRIIKPSNKLYEYKITNLGRVKNQEGYTKTLNNEQELPTIEKIPKENAEGELIDATVNPIITDNDIIMCIIDLYKYIVVKEKKEENAANKKCNKLKVIFNSWKFMLGIINDSEDSVFTTLTDVDLQQIVMNRIIEEISKKEIYSLLNKLPLRNSMRDADYNIIKLIDKYIENHTIQCYEGDIFLWNDNENIIETKKHRPKKPINDYDYINDFAIFQKQPNQEWKLLVERDNDRNDLIQHFIKPYRDNELELLKRQSGIPPRSIIGFIMNDPIKKYNTFKFKNIEKVSDKGMRCDQQSAISETVHGLYNILDIYLLDTEEHILLNKYIKRLCEENMSKARGKNKDSPKNAIMKKEHVCVIQEIILRYIDIKRDELTRVFFSYVETKLFKIDTFHI